MKKFNMFLMLFIFLFLVSCKNNTINEEKIDNIVVSEKKVSIEKEPIEISVKAVGDIMCHDTQYKAAYNEKTLSYDFSKQYKYVKDYFYNTDLVIGNYESTCAVGLYPLGGYPLFNSPRETIEILKHDGFSILSTCNNHTIDSRKKGIISTIETMNSVGIDHFGTRKDANDSRIFIKNIKGINVGFLAYSYGFNGMENTMTDEDLDMMVNFLDEEKIKSDIEETRKAGADFIIIYPHWGEEYSTKANDRQRTLAKKMLDWGADIILGSHPHILEEAEMIESNGVNKFVIYSMGNFIHDQYPEALGGSPVDTGVIVDFKIFKDIDDKCIAKDIKLIPTYVNRVRGDKKYWEVIPTDELLEGGKFENSFSNNVKEKALKRRELAFKIMNFNNEEE